MKAFISYILVCIAAAMLMLTACKGNLEKTGGAQADSGQKHIGNSGPADSSGLVTSPTETGGKDSSGSGQGTANAPKDTLKKNH